ncbi:MAG: J domain-containing protein [Planctomycetaceae bacterium]|nr:J domain-containing protein [Planctomycetaceae bacterium]
MPRDPYEVLGVSKSASADEIQKAYRKLSKKHHPDRNPGDKAADAAYKEVQEAYEVIGDATKKANFDQFGFAGPPQAGFPGGGGFPGGFPGGGGFSGGFPGGGGGSNIDPEMAEELFKRFVGGGGMGGGEGPDLGDLFGGGRRKARPRGRRQPAEPIEAEVSVPFLVAATGGTIGLQIGDDHIDLKVPAGIEEGKKLRVKGDDSRPRDVLLKVKITPHAYFRREGNDIILDVPIGMAEAVMGGKVEVPTVGGERLEVKIRPGTNSGARLRLRGKGINGGDQYLVFKILVPQGELSEESRKLIEEFAKLNPQTPRANVAWA